MIPKNEKDTAEAEIAANDNFSVIFDGSTRLGEALAIVLRFNDQWKIKRRLATLEVLAKSLDAEQLEQRLIQCLAVEYPIKPNQVLAAMRHGAAVNEDGLRQVKFYFPNTFSVTCFSHTIDNDNVGKHFLIYSFKDIFKVLEHNVFS